MEKRDVNLKKNIILYRWTPQINSKYSKTNLKFLKIKN